MKCEECLVYVNCTKPCVNDCKYISIIQKSRCCRRTLQPGTYKEWKKFIYSNGFTCPYSKIEATKNCEYYKPNKKVIT